MSIREVAQAAKVSPATVSNVLNGNLKHVSSDTARRIQKIVAETGYIPDTAGRNLRRRSTDTVGVIILNVSAGQISEPWIATLLSGISSVMRKEDKTILVDLWQTGSRERYQRIFHGNLFDGAILIGPKRDEQVLLDLAAEHYPFVAVEWSAPGLRVNSVCSNDSNGAYLATKHLLDLGHRRIAMINGDIGFFSATERLNGYGRALAEKGFQFAPELVVTGDFSEDEGARHVEELMAQADPPTAVFAGDDLLAVGAINGLHQLGLEVPRDVSVVGFDDIQMARHLTPPLTTVRLPMWEMGVAAAELLEQVLIAPKRQARQVVFDVDLVVRGTSEARREARQAL